MSWSAAQYSEFENERTRPVRDLVAAIPTRQVRRAVDAGCGPGNSTEVLAARYPEASISGFDSSSDMIEAARKRMPGVVFEVADVKIPAAYRKTRGGRRASRCRCRTTSIKRRTA